ncbi:NADH:ubiquinone reductase (Na(+)-transporting) subunit B [Wandonia haliotis]|uniref:Na(+)-translocating NADH-quinone reductase subunit B n=1 Tax=Wandonia haliotis TaxID=574963 RepID=A0ABN1MPH8_9FLAO
MKFLEKKVKSMEPIFAKGGKLEKLHYVYDGLATFLFTPATTTKRGAHIRDGVDLKRTMFIVVMALVPALLFGMYNTGHWHMVAESGNMDLPYLNDFGAKLLYGLIKVLPMVVVSYAVGLGVEFIFCTIKGHPIHEGFLVSGMLIPLVMPVEVPLWMVAVATIFAVVIGKEVFGGTGMNILNVALTARAFLFFAYPTSMSGDKVWMGGQEADGFSGATFLGDAASLVSDSPTVDGATGLMDKFSAMDSFIGIIPGSIGETSVIACLIGAVILIATGVGSLRVMLSFALGGLGMGYLFNLIGPGLGNEYMQIPAYMHLLVGGFAFGAIFMATDPVTAAQTATGKIWYGVFGGMLAVMIRVLNPAYPEGVMLAILFMNVMAPLIDHYVVQVNINRRLKRLKTA